MGNSFEWLVQRLPRCLACGRHFVKQATDDYACLPCRGVTFGEPLTDDDRRVADALLRQVFG
jgi:DNA-directed RNA polymerase subunit RPC12/RpoP